MSGFLPSYLGDYSQPPGAPVTARATGPMIVTPTYNELPPASPTSRAAGLRAPIARAPLALAIDTLTKLASAPGRDGRLARKMLAAHFGAGQAKASTPAARPVTPSPKPTRSTVQASAPTTKSVRTKEPPMQTDPRQSTRVLTVAQAKELHEALAAESYTPHQRAQLARLDRHTRAEGKRPSMTGSTFELSYMNRGDAQDRVQELAAAGVKAPAGLSVQQLTTRTFKTKEK